MSTNLKNVAQQAELLTTITERLNTATREASSLAARLGNAAKAYDPAASAGAHHDAIAALVFTLKSSAHMMERRILGYDVG